MLSACAATPKSTASDPAKLAFVHLNDTYRVGSVEDGKKGGFGRVVTVMRELQRAGNDVRVLHGGDFLYPSLESQLWNGEQMIEAMNYIDALAPLFVVPGNHEFDRRTPESLINALRASNFDWLGDNIALDTGDRGADAAMQSLFTYVHAGKTVGVFSLTLEHRDGGNLRDYAEFDRDYLGVAKRSIERLEAQGVDLIIGLTHLHMSDDLRIAALRQQHPKFAFIVGGHEHEPQYSPFSADSAAVMKGASNARVIWSIEVSFDVDGVPSVEGRQLPLDESIAEDADYMLIAARWRQKLLQLYPFLDATIGHTALRLDVTEETIRNKEASWGNFVVDQMRSAFGAPAADFSFINSGTLRIDDYIEGDITFEDVARTFGFSSFLRRLTISGGDFLALMEAGFRGEGESKGYFPQISGFRVCVDQSRPDGQRIVSMQLPDEAGWTEIDPHKQYSLVMSDFLFRGNDGYELTDAQKLSASPPGSELKYLVLDAIFRAQAAGESIGVPVDPDNPRIEVHDHLRGNCFD